MTDVYVYVSIHMGKCTMTRSYGSKVGFSFPHRKGDLQ